MNNSTDLVNNIETLTQILIYPEVITLLMRVPFQLQILMTVIIQDTHFTFTGPDRAPVKINSVSQYLKIADVITSTGLPNYKRVRYPIQSGFNVQAWERYLSKQMCGPVHKVWLPTLSE